MEAPVIRAIIVNDRETWQYRGIHSNTWRGNFRTQAEAEEGRREQAKKVAERTERMKERRLSDDAQHLNAVLRKAMELDPDLWAKFNESLRKELEEISEIYDSMLPGIEILDPTASET